MGRPGPRWEAGEIGRAERVRPKEQPGAPRGSRPPPGLPDASLWKRAAAWLIDEVARTLFYAFVIIFFVTLGGSLPEPVSTTEPTLDVVLPQVVMRVGVSWIFWSQGTSLGAMVMSLRIVDSAGQPPGPARGGIRAAVEVVSIFVLFIGFAWALFTRRRQTWHDLAAGTYVVEVPREE